MKQPVLYSASLVVIMALLYAVGLFDKQKDPNEVTLSELKNAPKIRIKPCLFTFMQIGVRCVINEAPYP